MKYRIWCDKYQTWCDLAFNPACKSYFTTGGCIYAKTIIYFEKKEEVIEDNLNGLSGADGATAPKSTASRNIKFLG